LNEQPAIAHLINATVHICSFDQARTKIIATSLALRGAEMKSRRTAPDPDSITMVDLVSMAKAAPAERKATAHEPAERPTVSDLATQLRFSPRTGRIWLGEQRMLLLHGKTFAALRHELIERLGFAGARAMLMRIGYASGARDAELVRREWRDRDDELGAFTAGTRLHALEGVVKVTPLRVTSDIAHGQYEGEYLWHDSLEATEFVASYGLSREPMCWMQLGYASGYASAFLGKLAIFRELECAATGAPACRILGKPADAWGEHPEELQFLNADLSARHSRVISVPNPEPAAVADGIARKPVTQVPAVSYGMVGVSAAFSAARHRIERVAGTSATVLFIGESGVGKELFARALHEISPRRDKPFVALNCAAIPDTLVESELFGIEKGAYTGAVASRPGRFERASGGTLFLDEVPSLSLIAQGKLLRAIQEREIDRVGGTHSIKVDVRVAAATNLDLREAVRAGRFREDLYFRLNVFPIRLPPLRERRDDIPLLLEHFLTLYNKLYGKTVAGFHRRAVEALLNYDYPGNIRELQNIVERGVISAQDNGTIDLPDIFQPADYSHDDEPEMLARPEPQATGVVDGLLSARGFSLIRHEREIYRRALERSGGNVSAAARMLGLRRAQLAYRLKALEHDS
jgi:DNA-binding NtrC family response regulator/predicted hydrocarbon binding protein